MKATNFEKSNLKELPLKTLNTMKANISIGEGIIRIILGMIFAAIMGSVFTGYIALLGVLAIYPIVTGLGNWDPIYALKGKYTNEVNPYDSHEASNAAPASIRNEASADTNQAA
jgi:hypothetical protein